MVFCNDTIDTVKPTRESSHNPYFNRWFSAIKNTDMIGEHLKRVTILILIDGFLQFSQSSENTRKKMVTILILIDGFLQSVQQLYFVHQL